MQGSGQFIPEVEKLGVTGILYVCIDAQGLWYVHAWVVQDRYDFASVIF